MIIVATTDNRQQPNATAAHVHEGNELKARGIAPVEDGA
jgi:hypothetical protein